jgi:hypothetical protein
MISPAPCVQRANDVFSHRPCAGLYAPNLAASLGGLYLVGRVLYTLGYINAGPKGRLTKGGLLATVGYYRECLPLSPSYPCVRSVWSGRVVRMS